MRTLSTLLIAFGLIVTEYLVTGGGAARDSSVFQTGQGRQKIITFVPPSQESNEEEKVGTKITPDALSGLRLHPKQFVCSVQ